MKKSISILIAMVFCLHFTGLSQETKVGFTGGLSISNIHGTDPKGDSRTGLTFGLIIDKPLGEHITFQPGLHYVQKGTMIDQAAGSVKQELITALRYAELQFNFLLSTNSGAETLFVGAGPTASITFPSKFVTKTGKTRTDSDITFGNETEDFRAFDCGANILGGFRFHNGFIVSFNYTLGIRDITPGGSGGANKINNTCFGIRLGWLVPN